MIKWQFLLIPFASRNVVYNDVGILGFTDFYIFGIRIVRIQRTHPW